MVDHPTDSEQAIRGHMLGWGPDTPFQTCTNTSTWHTMEVGLRTMNPNGMAVLSGCALMTHYVLKRLTLKCGMSPIIPHSTQSVKLQKIASIRRCILSREQHIWSGQFVKDTIGQLLDKHSAMLSSQNLPLIGGWSFLKKRKVGSWGRASQEAPWPAWADHH